MSVATDVLGDYAPKAPAGDLYASAEPSVAGKWAMMANGLAGLCEGDWAHMHEQVSRQIQDLGLTFRVTGDEDEREWPLNPMPVIIGTQEWYDIARGLIQRADLLERVVADIYGDQQLILDGHLPAALVSGSRHFVPKMVGVPPPDGHYIHVYAVDLARGPNGEWRVLADRVRFATGIGYTLENRIALSRSTSTLLSDINARRLANFFTRLRDGIAADCQRDEPRIALLTPGRFNQSYPEQAHLARYLGFPLVEGSDLTVSQDKLYVRTIAGPKRIDALWRWIDTRHLDPLSFDARSHIGVPDLFEACSKGGLMVANWPGAGVLEARAFAAFLPRLCRTLLGRDLLLPNVATWWCGQENEAHVVHERFDEMVISSAFGGAVEGLPQGRTTAGASFSASERQTLFDAIERRPMDYAGQEIVHLSTTPALIGDRFEPRPFTLRAFVARDGDGNWAVMPGGFARLSSSGDLRSSLMGSGDLSADVCVVDDLPVHQDSLLSQGAAPAIRRSGGILASQAADNLFWFSRYTERAEMTVRIIRTLLGSSMEADGGVGRDSESLGHLVQLLVQWGAIAQDDAKLPLTQICGLAFSDREKLGAVTTLINTSRSIGRSLRDRMSNDVWRIANRPAPVVDQHHAESMIKATNSLIERFAAIAGLQRENMVRSPAWRFADMGRRLERALNLCRITRQLSTPTEDQNDLGILLDLCDSQIAYRSRYLAAPMLEPVLDLVLLDPENPRSLMFQIEAMASHIMALPQLLADGIPEPPMREVRAISSHLQSTPADAMTVDAVHDIELRLLALSDAISTRYFLQYEKSGKPEQHSFLA
ncbi:MAG: circularly permuted type 2 ATP-grasp protein [Sphingobium sp.]